MKPKLESILRFAAPLLRGWGPLMAFVIVIGAAISGLPDVNTDQHSQPLTERNSKAVVPLTLNTHPNGSNVTPQPRNFADWLSEIERLPGGAEKEAAVKAAVESADSNSLELALEKLKATRDSGVLRVAQQVIATRANASTIQALVDAYDNDPSYELRHRLVDTMNGMTSLEAMPSLISLIADPDTSPLDEMIRAAAHSPAVTDRLPGLDALLERIQAEPTPESRAVLTTALSTVTAPELSSALRETALGQNKVATSDDARTAAVYALGNMSDEASKQVLKALSSDPNQQLAEAATWMLSKNRINP